MKKHIRDHFDKLRALAEEHGCTATLDLSRKHPAAVVELPDGRTFRLVFAGTPSCGAAGLNSLQDMRRELRTRGAKL